MSSTSLDGALKEFLCEAQKHVSGSVGVYQKVRLE